MYTKDLDNPFFSIMIPIYNKINYLNRSFSSVYCQTFSSYEIIAVDDCSTDGSIEFLQKISSKYIKVINHNQNLGTLNSRVDAIKASKGKYLITLDPDDKLDCGLLNILYSFLFNEHYDILEYQYITYERSGKKRRSICPSSKFLLMNRSTLFTTRWPWNWSLWRKCFSYDILLKGISNIPKRLFDIHLTGPEDVVIFFYTVVLCNKYLIINYVGYIYYQEQKGSAGLCGYFSCAKKREMGVIAYSYAKNILSQHNITGILKK